VPQITRVINSGWCVWSQLVFRWRAVSCIHALSSLEVAPAWFAHLLRPLFKSSFGARLSQIVGGEQV
jgi:hypothetical protein